MMASMSPMERNAMMRVMDMPWGGTCYWRAGVRLEWSAHILSSNTHQKRQTGLH